MAASLLGFWQLVSIFCTFSHGNSVSAGAKNKKQLAESVKVSRTPPIRLEELVTMNNGAKNGSLTEPSLVKLYMDLTGSTESGARSVFMHVCNVENGVLAANGNGVSRLGLAEKNHWVTPSSKPVTSATSGWTGFRAPVVPVASGV